MPVPSTPPAERVLARVVEGDGCWIFQGALSEGGYGIVQMGRGVGTRKAHRVVYEYVVGLIPAGLQIDHLCNNTRCVNPAHLEPVTQRENLRRQKAAGRFRGGAQNRVKTECPNGHPYDSRNTYRDRRGRRSCRACKRLDMRRRRAAA